TETSSSRRAESRLDTVCRGCTTRSRAAQAKPHKAPSNKTVSVQRVCDEKSPRQSSTSATMAAGKPESSASTKTRRWWVSFFGTEIGYGSVVSGSLSVVNHWRQVRPLVRCCGSAASNAWSQKRPYNNDRQPTTDN